MTEAEWDRCNDPVLMLRSHWSKGGDRKWSLLACSFVRRLWPLLADERCRRAVEQAEMYADGLVHGNKFRAAHDKALAAEADARAVAQGMRVEALTPEAEANNRFRLLRARRAERARAWAVAWAARAVRLLGPVLPGKRPNLGVWSLARRTVIEVAQTAAGVAKRAARAEGKPGPVARERERRAQCELIRDVLGGPTVAVRPDWLTANDGCAAKLARAIVDGGRFGDLPILGDALAEAGCDDETLLAHCYCGRPHARGCWLLDLVLDKV